MKTGSSVRHFTQLYFCALRENYLAQPSYENDNGKQTTTIIQAVKSPQWRTLSPAIPIACGGVLFVFVMCMALCFVLVFLLYV